LWLQKKVGLEPVVDTTQRRYLKLELPVVCGIKNARKMFNLAVLFALHLQIFLQKTASQAL